MQLIACTTLLLLKLGTSQQEAHTLLRSSRKQGARRRQWQYQNQNSRRLGHSSDDTSRLTVLGLEEQLEYEIPPDIETPDDIWFGAIRSIAYDDLEDVYYALSADVLSYHRDPTEAHSLMNETYSSEPSDMPSSTPTTYAFPELATEGTESPSAAPSLDRSNVLHRPRFYTLVFDEDNQVHIQNVTYLKDLGGLEFDAGSVMPLAIAYSEERLFISLDEAWNVPEYARPSLWQFDVSGQAQQEFYWPDELRFDTGFTGLTVSPNHLSLYAISATALQKDPQDYVRLIEFNLETYLSTNQYVYPHESHANQHIAAIMAMDDNGGFLVLEQSDPLPWNNEVAPALSASRTFAPGDDNDDVREWPPERYNIQLFRVRCLNALNVASVSKLDGLEVPTMKRTLVEEWSNTTLRYSAISIAGKTKYWGHNKKHLPVHDSYGYNDEKYLTEDLALNNTTNATTSIDDENTRRSLGKYDKLEIILMTDNGFEGNTTATFFELAVEETPVILPKVETSDVLGDSNHHSMASDPAIWIHPTRTDYSLIVGALGTNGIGVYGLPGNIQQIWNGADDDADYVSVDLMYAFRLRNDTFRDLAIVSDRANEQVRVLWIQHDLEQGNFLTDLTNFTTTATDKRGLDSVNQPRHVAAYTSPFTGKHYMFVVVNWDGDAIDQFELVPMADGTSIQGRYVRTIGLAGTSGGMVVDQELGYLYVSLNDNPTKAIVKYDAEPNELDETQSYPETIVAGDEPYLNSKDIQGLSIYYGDRGEGYLVVSVAGDSTFAVFERNDDNQYFDSFTIGKNHEDITNIDRVDATKGVDITNVNLGPEFQCGLMVVQDSDNADVKIVGEDLGTLSNANSNFKLVPFEELSEKLYHSLDIDTDSWGPRRFALTLWVNYLASDVYAALNDHKLSGRDTERLLHSLNAAVSNLYQIGTKKQQIISLQDPFDNGHNSNRRDHHQRSLQERRLQSQRRLKAYQQARTKKDSIEGRKLKESECHRRRLRSAFDQSEARKQIQEFIDYLNTLYYVERLDLLSNGQYDYWIDLSEAIRDQLPL